MLFFQLLGIDTDEAQLAGTSIVEFTDDVIGTKEPGTQSSTLDGTIGTQSSIMDGTDMYAEPSISSLVLEKNIITREGSIRWVDPLRIH